VLASSDVVALYPVHPAAREIASRVLSAVIPGREQRPQVLVSSAATGTSAEVSVGVSGERAATAVCRDLHDSIAAELVSADAVPPFVIAVKISNIV
jgi:hypothetical protein